MLLGKLDDLSAQHRIFQAGSKYVEQIELAAGNQPCRADRVIVCVADRRGDVPALDDTRGSVSRGWSVVMLKPVPPDEIPLGRYGLLLILCGKLQATDVPPNPVQDLARFPIGLEYLAGCATVNYSSADLN